MFPDLYPDPDLDSYPDPVSGSVIIFYVPGIFYESVSIFYVSGLELNTDPNSEYGSGFRIRIPIWIPNTDPDPDSEYGSG